MLGIAVLLNTVKLTLIGLRDVYGCESVFRSKNISGFSWWHTMIKYIGVASENIILSGCDSVP